MSRFNLIDEKWIPVRFLDGRRDELGIRDTILRAKEIAGIEDASPLVVAAMHRFLLAVLYRALEGPTDIDQAKKLFKDGLPNERVTTYLEHWRDRFWLFDEQHPFGQNPDVPKDQIEPWTKLTAEYNATSNKVLFDHTDTKNPGSRKPQDCSRWLLSTMTFSIAGGRGYYLSPSANALMCIPLGRTLQESLCYNLVPYQNAIVMRADSALWERDPSPLPLSIQKRTASGYADLYTWQPRMILLEELPSGDVMTMRFVSGQGFDNSFNNPDPMQAYRIHKTKGKLPVQFRPDRGAWRDFDSLLPDKCGLYPLTIQHSLRLAARNPDLVPKSVLVLGLRNEPPNANVDFWRMESFALPTALAGEQGIRSKISELLAVAEESQGCLWAACRSFAADLLSKGDRRPQDKDISAFSRHLGATSWYWSSLESRFHEVLREYTLSRDSEDIDREWLQSVYDALAGAWDQHRLSVAMGDAWTIRAIAKAETGVLRKLEELKKRIAQSRPEEECQ